MRFTNLRLSAVVAGVILLASVSMAQSQSGLWRETVSTSPMDDITTVTVQLSADAPVSAWLKTATPTLVFRCRAQAFDAYIVLDTAPRAELGDMRRVRVRFDSDLPQAEMWGISDLSSALFSPAPADLLDRLQTARRFLFEFTPFNAPPVVATFSPQGLAAMIQRLVETCPHETKTLAQQMETAKEVALKHLSPEHGADARAESLVGVPTKTMRLILGDPATISVTRYGYDTTTGERIYLYIDRSGELIAEVSDPKLPLSAIKRTN